MAGSGSRCEEAADAEERGHRRGIEGERRAAECWIGGERGGRLSAGSEERVKGGCGRSRLHHREHREFRQDAPTITIAATNATTKDTESAYLSHVRVLMLRCAAFLPQLGPLRRPFSYDCLGDGAPLHPWRRNRLLRRR
jgi:hypothetical protein